MYETEPLSEVTDNWILQKLQRVFEGEPSNTR